MIEAVKQLSNRTLCRYLLRLAPLNPMKRIKLSPFNFIVCTISDVVYINGREQADQSISVDCPGPLGSGSNALQIGSLARVRFPK